MTRNTLCLAVSLALAAGAVQAGDWHAKTASAVQRRAATDEFVDVMILLGDRPAAPAKRVGVDYVARRAEFVSRLQRTAEASQRDLRAFLGQQGVAFRAYWVANTIAARVPSSLLPALGSRP